MKKNFWFHFFVSDVLSGVGFWPFWLRSPGLKPLDGLISLKFVLETQLESEPLIDFLGFCLKRYSRKTTKQINSLIR